MSFQSFNLNIQLKTFVTVAAVFFFCYIFLNKTQGKYEFFLKYITLWSLFLVKGVITFLFFVHISC